MKTTERQTSRVLCVAEPMLVGPADAARMLGISKSTLDRWDKRGDIGPRPLKIGDAGRVLYAVDELKTWVAAGCPPRVKWNQTEPRLRVAGNG